MSTRSIFKASVSIYVVVLAALLATGLVIWWIRGRQGGPLPTSQAIKDSLEVNRQLEVTSQDSALFHYKIYEKSIKVGDSIFSDSLALDSARADYSAKLRAKIRKQLQDSAARFGH